MTGAGLVRATRMIRSLNAEAGRYLIGEVRTFFPREIISVQTRPLQPEIRPEEPVPFAGDEAEGAA